MPTSQVMFNGQLWSEQQRRGPGGGQGGSSGPPSMEDREGPALTAEKGEMQRWRGDL